MRTIDLRSDTVTHPTPEMRQAMFEAEVGDDVLGDDPTVQRLEAMAAERMGKEAAVYVSSGTMGNLLAVLSWCDRGDEVILGSEAHILWHESAGSAAVAGTLLRAVPNDERGRLDPDDVATRSSGIPVGCIADRDGGAGEHAQPVQRGGPLARRHQGRGGRRPRAWVTAAPGRRAYLQRLRRAGDSCRHPSRTRRLRELLLLEGSERTHRLGAVRTGGLHWPGEKVAQDAGRRDAAGGASSPRQRW